MSYDEWLETAHPKEIYLYEQQIDLLSKLPI